jgi:transposase
VSGLGLAVRLILTPGPAGDAQRGEEWIEGKEPQVGIGDKAYDSPNLIQKMEGKQAEAVIPSQKNR